MKPISYELEVIFLQGIMDQCQEIRQRHDVAREKFSSNINELFNTSWAKASEPIKRGAMIGALKSGETVLNETHAYIQNLEKLIHERIMELSYCHKALENKKKKGKK